MKLFKWNKINAASDLYRLKLVLEALPDEKLMRTLERERKGERDDYPVQAMWNSLLAGLIYGHAGIESLRCELLEVCRFDPVLGAASVPASWVYTQFVKKLVRHLELAERIFDEQVGELAERVPDLGRCLATDFRCVWTYARGRKDPSESADPVADGPLAGRR